MRVLLVEDDVTAARGISLILKNASFTIDHTDMGREALEMVRHYDYDLILLDLALPDIDGHEVVRRMRAARLSTPVIVLSAVCGSPAKVKAFTAGADDFITTPFDHAELIARMQAILRRSKGYSEPTLRVGGLQLNLDTREVRVDGKEVHLTGKEYAVLELLVLRKGMVLTKDAFLNHLYGGMDEPEMKIIDVFVCKLRKKLQVAGAGNLVGTVWGRGYILREETKRAPALSHDLAIPAAPSSTSSLALSAAGALDRSRKAAAPTGSRSRLGGQHGDVAAVCRGLPMRARSRDRISSQAKPGAPTATANRLRRSPARPRSGGLVDCRLSRATAPDGHHQGVHRAEAAELAVGVVAVGVEMEAILLVADNQLLFSLRRRHHDAEIAVIAFMSVQRPDPGRSRQIPHQASHMRLPQTMQGPKRARRCWVRQGGPSRSRHCPPYVR